MSRWLSLLRPICAAVGLARHYPRRLRGSPGDGKLEAYDPVAPRPAQAPIEVRHKLTVVLPIKIRSHHQHSELERIRRLLLPSFLKFFALDDLHEFIVIAPPEDAGRVSAGVEPFAEALRIKVLCDDDIAPCARGMTRGWRKQQILKLGIARLVRTPWYLAVDSDNLLVRPTGLREIAPKGVPLLVREPFETHPSWYRGSARVLRYPLRYSRDDAVFGVTPQVLHTEIARGLAVEIERRNGVAPWETLLARRKGWSEYSLYWLYLNRYFRVETLYDLAGPALHQDCIWHGAEEFDDAFVRRVFEGAQASFTVVQSRIADLSVSDIHARVGRYLELPSVESIAPQGRRRR